MYWYYKSEKEAAFHALEELKRHLPDTPKSASECPEYGTIIYRWPDEEEGGYKYSFQTPVYAAVAADGLWQPLYGIPSFAAEWAFCHTHPNDSYFSTVDTATARSHATVMYMVNRKGAYWYDGRTGYLSDEARKGKLWGSY